MSARKRRDILPQQLESIGIENLVVRLRNWDKYDSKVKTDARDALLDWNNATTDTVAL